MSDSPKAGSMDLRALEIFEQLTSSEAHVFEERMTVTKLQAGEALSLDGSVSVRSGLWSLLKVSAESSPDGPGGA